MDQHFVPETYLKEFSNPKGEFYSLENKYKHISLTNAAKVCYIKDYYDIADEQDQKRYGIDNPRFIENSFKYEKNLRALLSFFKNRPDKILTEKVISIIEVYLSIKQRNPFYIKKLLNNDVLDKVHRNAIEAVVQSAAQHPDYMHIDSTLIYQYAEKLLERHKSDPDYFHRMHLSGLVDTAKQVNELVKETVERLRQMNFVIYEASGNDYFVTTDNPGVIGSKGEHDVSAQKNLSKK